MIDVTLYSRSDCHLCEQARQELELLQSDLPHRLVVIDVDGDPKLHRQYGLEVPVVEVGPFKLKAPFSSQELRVTLAAARDRDRHISMIETSPRLDEVRTRGAWTWADSFSRWFSNHYMFLFNLVVVLYLAGAFMPAYLMEMGFERPANLLYKGYGLMCHQLGFRSVFLFGEQLVYPREAAHVDGLLTYSQATGLSEGSGAADLFLARNFKGNEQVGYKVALCQRDLLIYSGILLFGLLFSLSRYRLPPLPWYLWILLGVVPIAIDGFSQLLSQPPLSFLAYRESVPALRFLTGFLFGFTTAWFGFPVVEESMRESRRLYQKKSDRLMAAP